MSEYMEQQMQAHFDASNNQMDSLYKENEALHRRVEELKKAADRYRFVAKYLRLDDAGDEYFCLGLFVDEERLCEAVTPHSARLWIEKVRHREDGEVSVGEAIDAAIEALNESVSVEPVRKNPAYFDNIRARLSIANSEKLKNVVLPSDLKNIREHLRMMAFHAHMDFEHGYAVEAEKALFDFDKLVGDKLYTEPPAQGAKANAWIEQAIKDFAINHDKYIE